MNTESPFLLFLLFRSQVSPVLFKKNLDLLYKVKGSGMMKAGKLCVSAIFRPAPSVAKSGKYTYLHSGALCTLQSKTVKSEFYKIGKKQLNYSNNNNNSNNNKSNSNHPKNKHNSNCYATYTCIFTCTCTGSTLMVRVQAFQLLIAGFVLIFPEFNS